MLHEYELGHSAAEASRNINLAGGDGSIGESTARKWFHQFKAGDTSLSDKERSGAPSTLNKGAIAAAIEANPTLTTRMLAIDFDCSHTSIENVLHEIGKKWRQGRWIPHRLSEQQKNLRLTISQEHLHRNTCRPFLPHLVTSDEKWIFLEILHAKSNGYPQIKFLYQPHSLISIAQSECLACGGILVV